LFIEIRREVYPERSIVEPKEAQEEGFGNQRVTEM
jgi:hypothetical protein